MYMYIWTVKACGGGGGGVMLCLHLRLHKVEGCHRFLTILTMIAGTFRISRGNDSRVYNQSLIGKKSHGTLDQNKDSGER